ncbi:endo-1,4-beta-xylanase [Gemmata sp. JC673]|uniref:Endo-1,4-beta-xylanase n=1 Tax=Gemmata algarum TaxID=2975278 RepID=A0ABU5ER63_9BACT|nr:hypothetical protein [Gemmata algarum]MDY3557479.1 endo-1,4-beta-xylanase [Gemmata algarum]
MGSMSFLLPGSLSAAAAAGLGEACVAGAGFHDQTPGPTVVSLADGVLTLSRDEDESGYLIVPWPVTPFGTLAVISSTLRERAEPYRLVVELARGKVNQVRTLAAEWHDIGLHTTPEFDRGVVEVGRQFGRALLAPTPEESDALATRVLEHAHALADRLTRDYTRQMLATREKAEGRLDTRLAARHLCAPQRAAAAEYGRAFNAAAVGLRWRDIEAAEAQYDWTETDSAVASARAMGLPVTLGPVIDLGPGMMPPWAAGWAADLPTLAACMCDFLETALNRYKGDVRRWVVCAGFNQGEGLGLSDDDRLRLAYRLFEAAAQVDSGLELVLSVAQPWGEYRASGARTISPIAFPDDLLRAGVRLSGLELEIRPGVRPRGGLPRDLLDTARLLDVFGVLGLPLEVLLSAPAGEGPDRRAADQQQTAWASIGPTPEGQAEWGASFAALALCWPQVRSVTWDHWFDAEPHLVPHGGLLDPTGRPRPLLARLRALRNAHLTPEV